MMGRRVAVALLLLGSIAAAHTPARAADSVTIGTVGSASSNIWPVFIGQKKGFFAAENISLDVVYVQSSANLVQQLVQLQNDRHLLGDAVDGLQLLSAAPLQRVQVRVLQCH